jgi:hypothetical protein
MNEKESQNWWEKDFSSCFKDFSSSPSLWLELRIEPLIFHLPMNLLQLSYNLAKSKGKTQVDYELQGCHLRISLLDLEKLLNLGEGEQIKLILNIDGKTEEVIVTKVSAPSSNDTEK